MYLFSLWCLSAILYATAESDVEQVHLALGETSSSVMVTFATKWQPAGLPLVKYSVHGIDHGNATGSTMHFTENNPNGAQWIHRVLLTDLPPRTSVKYQACVQAEDVSLHCAATSQFTSLTDSPDFDPNLLVYGDLGRDGGKLAHELFTALPAMEKEVAGGSIDAALHMGDFAYDLHTKGGITGDEFMNRIQPIASTVFYQTVPGNHEILGGNFSHYRARFNMPHSQELGGFRMWYSMNIGKMHIVMMSTEVLFARPKAEVDAMLQWLETDLKQADASRAQRPWIITAGHRPPYCSNADDDCIKAGSAGERVRVALEELLYKHRVDLALWAHEHSYERTWPVFNLSVSQKNYVNAKAPVHIVTGAAGCNEGLGLCLNPSLHAKGDWSAFRTGLLHPYSYGHLRAPNSTHLHVDQINSLTGYTFDQVWLVKDPAVGNNEVSV